MTSNNIKRIHRSRIVELSFGRGDVLKEDKDRTDRAVKLTNAAKIGTQYRKSVKLQFQTSNGITGETEVTVWALTDRNVELRGGKIIPISAIINVQV